MKNIITFRGDRELWIDFVAKVKKNKKQVWQVLKQFIISYIKKK